MYSTSLKNNYYLMTSDDAIAVGGGGDFALYLVDICRVRICLCMYVGLRVASWKQWEM